MLKNDNQSMLIVEVKRIFLPMHEQREGDNIEKPLDEAVLKQNMKQLRSSCIHEAKNYMVGVVTNSQQWYFTRYDMRAEMKQTQLEKELQKLRRLASSSQRKWTRFAAQQRIGVLTAELSLVRPFEHSKPFKAFNFVERQDEISVKFDRDQFFKIFYVLQNIKVFCAAADL
jgi:hypothetical protein